MNESPDGLIRSTLSRPRSSFVMRPITCCHDEDRHDDRHHINKRGNQRNFKFITKGIAEWDDLFVSSFV